MPNPEVGSYYPRGVNMFVDGMQYHSEVDREGICRVKLNGVIASNAVGLLSALSIAAAQTNYAPDQVAYTATLSSNAPTGGLAPYGRGLQIVASGAATSAFTVRGRDYLGQPLTWSGVLNGATPVLGTKAFKWVDGVDLAVTAATTVNLGWTNVLGLPFCSDQLLQESVNDAATGNAGTFVAAVKTNPATSTTGDTRGTYTPNSANNPNGTNTYRLQVVCDKDRLHGVRAA